MATKKSKKTAVSGSAKAKVATVQLSKRPETIKTTVDELRPGLANILVELEREGLGIKVEKLKNPGILGDQGRFLAASPGCVSSPGGPSC